MTTPPLFQKPARDEIVEHFLQRLSYPAELIKLISKMNAITGEPITRYEQRLACAIWDYNDQNRPPFTVMDLCVSDKVPPIHEIDLVLVLTIQSSTERKMAMAPIELGKSSNKYVITKQRQLIKRGFLPTYPLNNDLLETVPACELAAADIYELTLESMS